MGRFDDLLNVHAYMMKRMEEQNGQARRVLQEAEGQLNISAKNLDEAHALIEMALEMGIELPDSFAASVTMDKLHSQMESEPTVDDVDDEQEFERILQEAHAAGFTQTHIESLLTQEEMEAARRYNEALDAQFERETALSAGDIKLLFIAAVIRVALEWIYRGIGAHSVDTEPDVGQKIFDAVDEATFQLSGEQLLDKAAQRCGVELHLRDAQNIIKEPVPFDIPDNERFKRKEIAGYDPVLGWLFGTMNILTGTVTTRNLVTYAVEKCPSGKQSVREKISAPVRMIIPVLYSAISRRETILTAALREAYELNVVKRKVESMDTLVQYASGLEEESRRVLKAGKRAAFVLGKNDLLGLDSIPLELFFNTLIAAVHSVGYDPQKDGELKGYAVRTQKIAAASAGLAAVMIHIPMLATGGLLPEKANWSIVLASLFSAVNSVRFWIDVKAEYLSSAYRETVNAQLQYLDRLGQE